MHNSLGITQEIIEAGGLSVTGGVSVDVSPLRVNVSGYNDFENPENSTISISGNAEIPGGLLGISGGVIINTSTGKIVGGSIGQEIGGIGVSISIEDNNIGLSFSYQLPFSPITLSIGLGYDIGPTTPTTPTTPTPTPTPGDEAPTPTNKTLPPGEPRNENLITLALVK
jgi:hypothetical protein